MTNTEETIMNTKDIFEVGYWVVSLIILGITVYWIKISPIKAVEIGRKLDEEKNKYDSKKELFLTLFSLRGNPTHYDFVSGLNQIDIVFEDVPKVMESWNKLYDSLGQKDLVDSYKTWEILRTNLLSEMAQHLGYNKLQQTDIQKNYSPIAHSKDADNYYAHKKAEREFFETATEMNRMVIQHYLNSQANVDNDNKQIDS